MKWVNKYEIPQTKSMFKLKYFSQKNLGWMNWSEKRFGTLLVMLIYLQGLSNSYSVSWVQAGTKTLTRFDTDYKT